jgi:HlyD family secretion protein
MERQEDIKEEIQHLEKDAEKGLRKMIKKLRKANKKTKIIIGIVLVIILIIVGVIIFKKEELPYTLGEVMRGDVIQEVSATGTVEAAEEVDLRFKTSGIIESINVKVGNQVRKGTYLARLAAGQIYSQFLQAQASYNQAKAKLDQLLAGASPEEIKVVQQVVENAQTALEDTEAEAENDLAEEYSDALDAFDNAYFDADKAVKKLNTIFDENTLYQDLRSNFSFRSIQTKNDMESKKTDVDAALEDLKDLVTEMRANPSYNEIDNAFSPFLSYLKIVRDGLDLAGDLMDLVILHSEYSQTQWDTDKDNIETGRTTINGAITDVLSAQQAVNNQKITNQVNINTAQSTLDKAKADLEELKAPPRAVDTAIYQADVDKYKANMNEFSQKLKDASIIAPFSGIVAKIDGKIGEVVSANDKIIISLISPGDFQIKADISEADIRKVDLEDPAEIVLDAFPEEKLTGQIMEIEPGETIIEGVVYYRIKILLEQIEEKVKSGMTADVTIETDKKENVLSVPQRAIIYKEDKRLVRILENKEIKEVEVETGLRGREGEIEIISGLSEEDEVITFIKK